MREYKKIEEMNIEELLELRTEEFKKVINKINKKEQLNKQDILVCNGVNNTLNQKCKDQLESMHQDKSEGMIEVRTVKNGIAYIEDKDFENYKYITRLYNENKEFSDYINQAEDYYYRGRNYEVSTELLKTKLEEGIEKLKKIQISVNRAQQTETISTPEQTQASRVIELPPAQELVQEQIQTQPKHEELQTELDLKENKNEEIRIEELLQEKANKISETISLIENEQLNSLSFTPLFYTINNICNKYQSQIESMHTAKGEGVVEVKDNNKYKDIERQYTENLDLLKVVQLAPAFISSPEKMNEIKSKLKNELDSLKEMGISATKEGIIQGQSQTTREIELSPVQELGNEQIQTQPKHEETKTELDLKENKYEKMTIEELLQQKANEIEKIVNTTQITESALKELSSINSNILNKYRKEIEKMYVSVDKDTLRRIETTHENAEQLGIKGDFIRNRNIPNSKGNPYDIGLVEASKFADGPKEKKFIEYSNLKQYQQLVNRYNEERKINAAISNYISKVFKDKNNATLMHDDAVLKSELDKEKKRLKRMGIEPTIEAESQKNIDEYVYAQKVLETLYKEASLYNGDQKTFNETLAQLKKEIAEIENKLKSKGLLEVAKKAYKDDFENRRKEKIEQYKNKQSNLEEEIRKLQSEIAKEKDLRYRINQVRGQIEADIKKLKASCASNPNNKELSEKLEILRSIHTMVTKIQEKINKKQPITEIFKDAVMLYTAMKVAKGKEILKDTTLGIMNPFKELSEKYEQNIEDLRKLTEQKNRQEISRSNKNTNGLSVVQGRGELVPQTTSVLQQTETISTPEQTQASRVIELPPAQEPIEKQPEQQPKLPKELRVEKRSAWQWIKDNKKQVLIAASLTALSVAVVVGLQQLIPSVMEYIDAKDISNKCNEMVENADNWWKVADVSQKNNLHLDNEKIAEVLEKKYNIPSVFESGSGSWKLGGKSTELRSFADAAKQIKEVAFNKVMNISRTAGVHLLSGFGIGFLSKLINGRSKNYGKFKEEIKKYTKKLKENDIDDNFYTDIVSIAQNINNDETLTDSEKRNLLRKITILYDKVEEMNQGNERGSR